MQLCQAVYGKALKKLFLRGWEPFRVNLFRMNPAYAEPMRGWEPPAYAEPSYCYSTADRVRRALSPPNSGAFSEISIER